MMQRVRGLDSARSNDATQNGGASFSTDMSEQWTELREAALLAR
jgi:hypothetical protein